MFQSPAKNNLGIIYKTWKGVPANPHASIVYFRQRGDDVAILDLAYLHFYEEIDKTNLDTVIELLVKSTINKNKQSFDLLCVAVIKKFKNLDASEIEKDFEKIDDKKGLLLANHILEEIQNQKTKDPNFYMKTFDKLKDINLVYYGEKVENQTEKKKK